MKQIINYLNKTVKKEKKLLIFIIIIFLLGVVGGSIFLNILTKTDKDLLINEIGNYFIDIKNLKNNVFGLNVFKNNMISDISITFLLFIFGISMIGILFVIIYLFSKGFILGLTLSSILFKYKIKGIIGIILFIFPVEFLKILIFILMSFYAVYSSLELLKALLKKSTLNFRYFLGKYLLCFLFTIISIIILNFLDSYLTPYLLKLFTYII